LTAESLLDAWARRDAARAHFRQQTQEHPILLCPAARLPPRREWNIGGKTVHYLDAWSYTEWSTCSQIRPPWFP